jgi:hypothetical protein
MVDGTTLGSQASMPANTMKTHTDQASPFASRTLPLSRALLLDAARVVLFAALLVLAGQVRFYPPGSLVPVTMQTAVVLLCGFWLRPRLAAAAVGLYLVAGFAVAAVAPGLAWFAAFALGKSTTLGYLFGFFAAAGLVSFDHGPVQPVDIGPGAGDGFAGHGGDFHLRSRVAYAAHRFAGGGADARLCAVCPLGAGQGGTGGGIGFGMAAALVAVVAIGA